MNQFSSTTNSPGLLKNVYKGPVAKMNESHGMIMAIRKKRDALRTK